MKLNVKRTMGISALALAMMMNVGAAAMAAEDQKAELMTPAGALPADGRQAVECEAASMESVDCNVTSIAGEEGKLEFVVKGADGKEYLLRFDDETGKASRSEDGGKTWEPCDASVPMVVQPIDGADGEYSVAVSFKGK